jgi:predicted ester cyclase
LPKVQRIGIVLLHQNDPSGECRDATRERVMSTEANKAVVRRYIEEANNGGNVALVDELIAPDYVWHGRSLNGPDALKAFLTWQRTTAPDWRIVIHDLIAEGDRVVVRATANGTRAEQSPGIPFPTPEYHDIAWIAIYRLTEGRINEVWVGAINQ